MIYILAFFLPFVALAIKGIYVQAIFNFILWVIAVICFFSVVLFWVGIPLGLICVVWAWISIAQGVNKQRYQQVLEEMDKRAGTSGAKS